MAWKHSLGCRCCQPPTYYGFGFLHCGRYLAGVHCRFEDPTTGELYSETVTNSFGCGAIARKPGGTASPSLRLVAQLPEGYGPYNAVADRPFNLSFYPCVGTTEQGGVAIILEFTNVDPLPPCAACSPCSGVPNLLRIEDTQVNQSPVWSPTPEESQADLIYQPGTQSWVGSIPSPYGPYHYTMRCVQQSGQSFYALTKSHEVTTHQGSVGKTLSTTTTAFQQIVTCSPFAASFFSPAADCPDPPPVCFEGWADGSIFPKTVWAP